MSWSRVSVLASLVAVAVAMVVASSPATSDSAPESASGDYGAHDLASGTYTYATPSTSGGEARLIYESRDQWLKEIGAGADIGRKWVAKVDGVVYRYMEESGEVSIDRKNPDLVPEGFLFDPLFLDRLRRDALPDSFRARSSGVAAQTGNGPPVPDVLEVTGDRLEVFDYSSTIEILPDEALEQVLAQDDVYTVEAADIPGPGEGPEEVDLRPCFEREVAMTECFEAAENEAG